MNTEPVPVVRVPPEPSRPRRGWTIALVALLAVATLVQLAFPGRRTLYAITIGTGIGRDALQRRIDALEEKAIRRADFTTSERTFLTDFYSTLATGAILTWFVRQTGHMMHHYLSGSGEPFELRPEIFTENRKVQRQAALLRKRLGPAPCRQGQAVRSPRFYMPDTSKIDSVFGLYYGTLSATAAPQPDGTCRIRWRAEVPWDWPSYPSLKRKHGRFHAESFPLPNARSIVLGQRHALYVDNGLGHHLEVLGLATSFVAFAEWDEAP